MYEFPVYVLDDNGNRIRKELELSIEPNLNQPPEIQSMTPAMEQVAIIEGENQVFTLSATDPEGSNVVYRWTLDGVDVGDGTSSFTLSTSRGELGTHELRCYVFEGLWQDVVYQQWNVTVENIPMLILPELLSGATQRLPYLTALQTGNGLAPYTWEVAPEVLTWGTLQLHTEGYIDLPEGALHDVVAVDTGYGQFMALRADGSVVYWGRQLGLPPCELTNIVAIAADCWRQMVVRADGTVVAWGNTTVNQPYGELPVPAGLTNVVAVAASSSECAALTTDGKVAVWGTDGNLDKTFKDLTNVVAIAGGSQQLLALKSDGTVVASGSGYFGRQEIPQDLRDVTDVSVGHGYSMAMKSDGSVVAWGYFPKDFASISEAAFVPDGLDNVVAISAGAYFATAMKADGSIVSWGNVDSYGRDGRIPASLPSISSYAAGNDFIGITDEALQLPEGLSLSSSGVLSGTPVEAVTNTVVVTARDSKGESVDKEFTIAVAAHQDGLPPVIESVVPAVSSVSTGETERVDFLINAYDPEGSNLVYRWTWDGFAVGSDSNTHTQGSDWGDAGLHALDCSVSDGLLPGVAVQWNVTILDDNDADGVVNAMERRAGTDPMDPNSVFGIRGMQGQSIAFHTVVGRSYQVYYSDDLLSAWQPLGAVVEATSELTEWVLPASADEPCRFYRIVVLEP